MPYKCLAQERYFNANRGKMEAQGVNVDEWNAASKGEHPPERAGTSAMLHGNQISPRQAPVRGH